METRKLYYEDSLLRTFCATVTDCRQTAQGFWVTLDATAFYPGGGGQPCDLGTLDSASVLDVQEQDAQILHLCDQALPVGQAVTGHIDWERRLDLMQQHSGEHILSGLVYRRFGFHNVGFHMGKDLVTVDFDGGIPQEALAELELEANRVVWQNLPLRCWYPDPQTLATLPYRRKKDLPWPVRIVEIPGVDLCACCGTQVPYTGNIGLIKLFSCVKFHQGVRLEMACGARALALLSGVYEQNRQVCAAFSAKMLETGQAARRANAQLAAEKLRAAGLQRQVFAAVAEAYRGQGNVVHFHEDLTPGQVRELADAIARQCGGIAAVASGADGAGYSLCLASVNTDVRPVAQAALQALGGRGGGRPEAVQGSVPASRQEIASCLARL